MGLGVWGLGVGVLPPTPKPQSPIPNPQFKCNINKKNLKSKIKNKK